MTVADLGLLLVRLAVGLTFAAHGVQKAFGWWGGPGPAGWHGAMERMGFRPPRLFAWTSTILELGGGLMLAMGLVTPIAAAALVAQSVVIVIHAHWPKGFFNTTGGIEFPLALGLCAAALVLLPAGIVSLDAALGAGWSAEVRLAMLAVGVVGGLAALAVPRLAARATAAAPAPRAASPQGRATRAGGRDTLRRT